MNYSFTDYGARLPVVSKADLKRIVERDFQAELHKAAWTQVKRYCGFFSANRDHRVCLAALKFADGDLSKLTECIDEAFKDYRDALMLEPLDWREYETWFDRK